LFSGSVSDSNRFGLTVKLVSLQSGQEIFLTNIYGLCNAVGRAEFTNWLYNYDVSNFDLWLVTGDFNLMGEGGGGLKTEIDREGVLVICCSSMISFIILI
jgi:hypothetical protein